MLARRGRPVAYGVRAWPNNGRVRTAAVDIPAYVERAWHDHARWQPYSDAYTAGVKTYRPTAGLWLVESHNHRQWCESAADAREARAEMVRDICKDYGWSPTLPDIRIAAGDNYRPYPAECYREECRTLNVGNARVAVYTYHYPNAAICPGCTHYTHGPRNRYTGIIRDTRYDDVCPDCIADQDAQDKEG